MSEERTRPALEVRVFVWVVLAVLMGVLVAFLWLFVLGRGFDFPF